tara:strand:- start:11397 stop:11675 length:279 start_codon:yes stop_codon:yes gene_type:complete
MTQLTRLETQFDAIQMVIEDLDVKVERLDEAIRGNGQTGLATKTALLERRISTCEEFILEFKSLRRWLAFCILTLFGSLAWRVVEWYMTQAT